MQLLIRSNDSPCNFRRWMRQWPYDRAEHASCNAFMAITKIMRQRRGAATETCLFSRKSTPGYSSRLCRAGQTARPGTNPSLDHDRTAHNFLYICHCIITDKFTSSRLHSESESIDRNREDLRYQIVSSPTWWFSYCGFLGDYDVVQSLCC